MSLIDSKVKKRVLFMAANPKDSVKLEIGKEFDEINKELRSSSKGDNLELFISHAVSVKTIQNLLFYYKPNLVHFSGHGSDLGYLVFESVEGLEEEVAPDALSDLFRLINRNKEIECVLLNACYSIEQAKAIVKHVDYVIGLPNEIEDTDAITFAEGFYLSLGYGLDMGTAFQYGVSRLKLSGVNTNLPELETSKEIKFVEQKSDSQAVSKNNISIDQIEKAVIEKKDAMIDQTLNISTDKVEYYLQDTVYISGRISLKDSQKIIAIRILNPKGLQYSYDQIEVTSDGSYRYSLYIGGRLGIGGQYRVIAKYNEITEETSFVYIPI